MKARLVLAAMLLVSTAFASAAESHGESISIGDGAVVANSISFAIGKDPRISDFLWCAPNPDTTICGSECNVGSIGEDARERGKANSAEDGCEAGAGAGCRYGNSGSETHGAHTLK